MIWQAKEWETPTGKWRCNCVDGLAGSGAQWFIPARVLNLSPAKYIEFMIKNFKPDHIDVNKEKCLVFFSWDTQTGVRKWKNFINKKAREINYQISE